MDSEKKFGINQKKFWISLTGYRTLKVLKLLLEKSRTRNELIDFLSKDEITSKSVSKDTIIITLNTLKAAGCVFSRPSKSNNFHYELLSHPFNLNLTDKEAEIFIKLQERLSGSITWQQMFILNDVYEKIFKLTADNGIIEKIKNSALFVNIDKDILSQLSNPKITGKRIKIKYISSKYDEEDLDIIPYKISCENNNLYLYCYIFKYKVNNLINISKIKKIISVSMEEYDNKESSYDVVYKVTGFSMLTFKKKEYETVLERTKEEITVKASVTNDFWFMQRLLYFGYDFEIVSPDFFKEKIINKIKQIRRVYSNDILR